MFVLDLQTAEDAVYGGQFFGGGGGGHLENGIQAARQAIAQGPVKVLELGELSSESTVVTASLVGSPSDGASCITPESSMRVYELFCRQWTQPIEALMANEAGGQSITNGWLIAAASGIPMVDAACNGRAHPTGVMGSMMLHCQPDYRTLQAAVGGIGEQRVELCAQGSIENTSQLVRNASSLCAGFVTVLRNPVTAGYAARLCPQGVLTQCMDIGRVLRQNRGRPEALLSELSRLLGARLLMEGKTADFTLTTRGGFDIGRVAVTAGARRLELTFWNEFMTAQLDGERLATFPDLIVLLDGQTGIPIPSACLENGREVCAVAVSKSKLLLAETMRDERLLRSCEEATGLPIVPYCFQ